MKLTLKVLCFAAIIVLSMSAYISAADVDSISFDTTVIGMMPIATTVDIYLNKYIAGISMKVIDGFLITALEVVKYDAFGNLAWRYKRDYPDTLGDIHQAVNPVKVLSDPKGNLYLVGYYAYWTDTWSDTTGVNQNWLYLLKIDLSGNLSWERLWRKNDSSSVIPADAALDGANNLIIGINSDNGIDGNAAHFSALIKYSSSGQFLWSSFYDFAATNNLSYYFNGIRKVIVRNNTIGVGGDYTKSSHWLARVSLDSGHVIWNSQQTAGGSGTFIDMAMGPQREFVSLSRSDLGLGIMERYDSSGTLSWQNNDDSTLYFTTCVDFKGNSWVAGTKGGKAIVSVCKYSPNGTKLAEANEPLLRNTTSSIIKCDDFGHGVLLSESANSDTLFICCYDTALNKIVTFAKRVEGGVNDAQIYIQAFDKLLKNGRTKAETPTRVIVIAQNSVLASFVQYTLPDNIAIDKNTLSNAMNLELMCEPNPFNPMAVISFDLPHASPVTLKLLRVDGQVIRTLVRGIYAAGRYRFSLNGTGLASGTYFCRMQAGTHSLSKAILLQK